MPNENDTNTDDLNGNEPPKGLDLPKDRAPSRVLSGAKRLLDGNTHTGIAVLLTSDGKPSTLMIPDISGVIAKAKKDKDGNPIKDKDDQPIKTGGLAPVYITKPVRILGRNLIHFLEAKKIEIPDTLHQFIKGFGVSCARLCDCTVGEIARVLHEIDRHNWNHGQGRAG